MAKKPGKTPPVYTRARHEVYQPTYVQKKIQLHQKIVFGEHDAREIFMSSYMSVTQFVAGSEVNGQMPLAFFNLQLGHYNKLAIHTRDVKQLAKAITELATWVNDRADTIQMVLDDEMDKYNDYQFKRWLKSNESTQDQPTLR
jgi:hypothetical protein